MYVVSKPRVADPVAVRTVFHFKEVWHQNPSLWLVLCLKLFGFTLAILHSFLCTLLPSFLMICTWFTSFFIMLKLIIRISFVGVLCDFLFLFLRIIWIPCVKVCWDVMCLVRSELLVYFTLVYSAEKLCVAFTFTGCHSCWPDQSRPGSVLASWYPRLSSPTSLRTLCWHQCWFTHQAGHALPWLGYRTDLRGYDDACNCVGTCATSGGLAASTTGMYSGVVSSIHFLHGWRGPRYTLEDEKNYIQDGECFEN